MHASTGAGTDHHGGGKRHQQPPMNLADLFVAPMFDELDAVAMDGAGELKRLSSAQLKMVREQGFVFDAGHLMNIPLRTITKTFSYYALSHWLSR